ncbi:MAG: porphobilinogen synthase, partial [Nitriliruptoraceae bacterium]
MRRLVRETWLRPEQLVLPLFLREGLDAPRAIDGLPGVVQHGEASLVDA